ncbi:MAG: hypothetical protein KGH60_02240 [Candidatus Micrarchaeota archaeon]|nr:hypothetical protein [Candidatus Micrarchaeota archaeon]
MPSERSKQIIPILAFMGGIISMLYVFYFMEHLSFSSGIYYGILNVVNAYNVTPTAGLVNVLSQASSIQIGVYFSYIMLPFALISFAIGVLWLFSKSYLKMFALVLVFSSIVSILLTLFLQLSYVFGGIFTAVGAPFIGPLLSLVAAGYALYAARSKQPAKRAVSQININPETPFSNMLMISNRLMSKMSGDLRILDMHFDAAGLENLARLIPKSSSAFTKISVLTKGDRLGDDFAKIYEDFKAEMRHKDIEFEIRILNPEDAAHQHERMMLDQDAAYKIPPLNIINKKSESIVSIKRNEAAARFQRMWQRGTKLENLRQQEPQPK